MFKIATLTAAAAFVAVMGFVGTAKAGLTDDLVSHWPFDEGSGTTATDIADGNDGTIVGAVFTGGGADAAPIPGNVDALRFDGDGDEVDVPDANNLDFASADDLTISLWAKREEIHTNRPIYHLLGKRVACGSMNYQLARDGGDKLHFNSSSGGSLSAGVDISLGTWAHIAVTYDSGTTTARIYVDGVLKNTNTSYTLGPTNSAAVKIGTSGTCDNTQRFIGVIDDVRIYGVALTADQIAALHNPALCAETVVADASIQDAVDANAGFVVCLSDTGTEFEQTVVFGPEDSGTTLRNVEGESPVLDGSSLTGPTTVDAITLEDGVSDVTIKGLEIRDYEGDAGDNDRSSAIQAWAVNTSNIAVKNNDLHDNFWNGILVGSEGAQTHTAWAVHRNTVTDNGFVQIELTNCNSCSIHRNTVDATVAGGQMGIVVQARNTVPDSGLVTIEGVSVKNNTVVTGRRGVFLLALASGPLSPFPPIIGAQSVLQGVSVGSNTITVIGDGVFAPNSSANEVAVLVWGFAAGTVINANIVRNDFICNETGADDIPGIWLRDLATMQVIRGKNVNNDFVGCSTELLDDGGVETKDPPVPENPS